MTLRLCVALVLTFASLSSASADDVSLAASFRLATEVTRRELSTALKDGAGETAVRQILSREQAAFRSIVQRFESMPDPRTLTEEDLLAVAEAYERRMRFDRTLELARIVLERKDSSLAARRIEFRSLLNLGRLDDAERRLLAADEEREAEGSHPFPGGHSALAARYEIARNWPRCRDHLRMAMAQSLAELEVRPQRLAGLDGDLRVLVRCARAQGGEREIPAILLPMIDRLHAYADELERLPTTVAVLKEEGEAYTLSMRMAIVAGEPAASRVFSAWLRAACRRLEVSLERDEMISLLKPIAAFAAGNRSWCAAKWAEARPETEEFSDAIRRNGSGRPEQRELAERFLALVSTAGAPRKAISFEK